MRLVDRVCFAEVSFGAVRVFCCAELKAMLVDQPQFPSSFKTQSFFAHVLLSLLPSLTLALSLSLLPPFLLRPLYLSLFLSFFLTLSPSQSLASLSIFLNLCA